MEESQKAKILDILRGPYFRIEPHEDSLALYDTALTHSSFSNERKQENIPCEDNEKLEFFGNYLLDFVIAGYLHDFNLYDPKEMNKRMKITANANLADVVVRNNLKIDDAIRFRGCRKPTMKMTANAFEAFIGAIYYAEGIEKAREVILGIFAEEIKTFDPEGNYAGRLKEYVERHPLGELKYQPFSEGPDHKKVWKAAVCLNGKELAQGIGCTKKRAEMDAARKALKELPAG
ncbi:ribonuclease III family protein [Methanoculleus oceani]|uniref:Ribonuclease III n=1 Tax=Methanoculleus oceani TaxID=2184756 RepID=A0ABD4TFN0_9EURY|nr:putative dsRNA-binding protein [Methanoculleus sp. CWC-02]MCM2466673.1 ribonuclease III [Methanoculleus sp. CWC-02]